MAEQETAPRTPKDREGIEKVLEASRTICRTPYELIRGAAARNPEHTAIALLPEGEPSDRPKCLSYGALLDGIHQTANLLADLGVEPGDVVALLLPNLLETHLLLWGGQAAGTVCPLSPRFPVEQAIALSRLARVKVLVAAGPEVSQEVWQQAEEVRRQVKSISAVLQVRGPGKERDGVYAFDALMADYPASGLYTGRRIVPDDIAISLPLRVATGMPNLVPLTHGNLLDVAWTIGNVLKLPPEAVLLHSLLHFIRAFWWPAL